MLKVNEIFRSFQGEGIDIGLPSIFVRFAGCNLKCSFCDTKYASKKNPEYKKMTFMQVVKAIEKLGDIAGVTLTGGEPFIQETADIDWLIYELKGRGYFVNIETNGIILPDLSNGKLVDRFSISPKLSSSGNRNAINFNTIEKYIKLYQHKIFFKFVISDRTDFFEIIGFFNRFKNFKSLNIPVVIQPNITNKTAESLEKQNKAFLKLLKLMFKEFSVHCKKYNIRIIPQFHKYLYKNKKEI